jgi:hypothetical protein
MQAFSGTRSTGWFAGSVVWSVHLGLPCHSFTQARDRGPIMQPGQKGCRPDCAATHRYGGYPYLSFLRYPGCRGR